MVTNAVNEAFLRAGVAEDEAMQLEQFRTLCEANLARLRKLGGGGFSDEMPFVAVFALAFPMALGNDGRVAVLGA